jgi:hypothetical protein
MLVRKPMKFLDRFSSERAWRASALFVIVISFLLAAPALLLPLGLPAEGDAIDYRIPLVRWILRHHALPVWRWSMVDDYPLLGELLMAPFYALHPGLARLVPLAGYAGLAAAGGALLAVWEEPGRWKCGTLILLGAAWVLGLRPATIQSNLLMVDNLAAAFLLGSLTCVLRGRAAMGGLLAAAAMGTRYTTWATAATLPFFLLAVVPKEKRVSAFVLFCVLASLGPLPFMLRNFFVNGGRPFFPIGDPVAMKSVGVDSYGRGKSLIAFLLLPWDLLYTNTFVNGFFDYTVGKLFYAQLLAVGALAGSRKLMRPRYSRALVFSLVFAFIHLLVWFESGQQMRFLLPTLVVASLWLLRRLMASRLPLMVTVITFLAAFSAISVQRDVWRLAICHQPTIFAAAVEKAKDCFARAQVGKDPVAFASRDGILGFFDMDFYFVPRHPYAIPDSESSKAMWVFSLQPRPGYEPWPRERPCLLRRIGPAP